LSTAGSVTRSRCSSPTSRNSSTLLRPETPSSDLEVQGPLKPHQNVTYLQGVSLVIGRQIGSGIFSAPSLVNRNAGSLGASLVVWFLSGCLAWTGSGTLSLLTLP
jgi:hypothetical protein